MFEGKHADISEKVIGAFYTVYNTMGNGFREHVYENALCYELRKAGLQPEQQQAVNVYYDGIRVGEYIADIIVNKVIILELKAVSQITDEHIAQLLSYLKATPIEVGYLLNFGPKAQYKRKILDNDRKGSLVWTKP